MTGKDLIVYILQHDLENTDIDDIINKILLSKSELAAKFNVGVDTIIAWKAMHNIECLTIRGTTFFYTDTKDPRKNTS